VIGLGTQDSPELGLDFIESTGTYSFPMFWDETFDTWAAFGIYSQPAAVLFDAEGEVLGGWLGAFPEDEVLALAGVA
jgi:hypothetical protein